MQAQTEAQANQALSGVNAEMLPSCIARALTAMTVLGVIVTVVGIDSFDTEVSM